MKKRVFACILALCLCVGLFVGLIAGCSHSENAPDPSKPQIVVTVFPIYDWMQNLLSDRAGEFGLTLLESSGADLHNYQPTVNDIYALSNCDLFVYIGGESDQWVADALTQAANKDMIRSCRSAPAGRSGSAGSPVRDSAGRTRPPGPASAGRPCPPSDWPGSPWARSAGS